MQQPVSLRFGEVGLINNFYLLILVSFFLYIHSDYIFRILQIKENRNSGKMVRKRHDVKRYLYNNIYMSWRSRYNAKAACKYYIHDFS